jgi:hypothetical protein
VVCGWLGGGGEDGTKHGESRTGPHLSGLQFFTSPRDNLPNTRLVAGVGVVLFTMVILLRVTIRYKCWRKVLNGRRYDYDTT